MAGLRGAGHVAVVEALRMPPRGKAIELPSVSVLPRACGFAAAVGIGALLRRWWPASLREGVGPIGSAVLDAEVAVLTATAEDYFTDDTLDADVAGTPGTPCGGAGLSSRPRVRPACARCRDLADEMGLQWDVRDAEVARREDYALAAGAVMSAERQAP
ncbi:hypothetical protein I541_5609 [Mycobacteroides abscessus]|nr:hypothetical protein I541_5609 [Mycobacteroides abscessus]